MRIRATHWPVVIPVVMLPLGLYLGYRAFRDHRAADIVDSILRIAPTHLAGAIACAAASYLCLSVFDLLAVRYVGARLPYRRILLTSFVSLSIGHNVGVAALSSGTLRYRYYAAFGLSAVQVGKIIVFCGVTVGLGLITLGGLALLVHPHDIRQMFGASETAARAAGIACLAVPLSYVVLAWRVRGRVRVRGHAVELPRPAIAAAQVGIGTLNFAFVAAALHQLLQAAVPYVQTVSAYVTANLSSLLSHVPGGLGVLEYVVARLIHQGDVVGALIGFRIVYFVVPLALGSVLLLASEIVRHRRRGTRVRA